MYNSKKNKIIEIVANDLNKKFSDIKNIFDCFEKNIRDQIIKTGQCKVLNLGTFKISKLKSASIKIPKKNKKINVPQRMKVKFKISKKMSSILK